MDASDRVPQVLRGEAANLDPFRRTQPSASHLAQTLEDNRVASDETLLVSKDGIPVTATLTIDEDSTIFTDEQGTFLISTERILFVSKSDDVNHDFAVDAECIQLHAISDATSIYIQIQENESSACMELTVSPVASTTEHSNDDSTAQCQALFEALSKLVSMHPIPLDDNDGDEGGFMDDAIIASPTINNGEASEEERAEMLQRLDDMLVVPPEYQVHKEQEEPAEGQFDDADEQEQQQDGRRKSAKDERDEDDAIL